jgi:hypothetical protein
VTARIVALVVLCHFSLGLAHAAVLGDEETYSSLYPYYAEFCAVSEIVKKPGFGATIIGGGPGGHSVLYLNGVCRDKTIHYPTIMICAGATPMPQRGVGLSVNAHYKNANWVATEGQDFLFHGTLRPGQPLTREAYQRTQEAAKKMGILDGVVFHDEVFTDVPAGMSRADFMYDVSVGTDYAIGFARDRYCARVPLSREKMAEVVRFLNALNDIYRDGKKNFEWDVLQDNCAHMTHNALAAVGVWDQWETGQFVVLAALDFPVPKNEFVNLARRTNDLPLERLDDLFADDAARRVLMTENWLPTLPGGLVESEPVVQQNEVYDTHLRLIFYDEPILGIYQRRFDAVFSEPRYLDIRANLKYFSALYARIAAARQPVDWYLTPRNPKLRPSKIAPGDRREFRVFYDQFYRYIEGKRAEIDAKLAALPAAQR